jgi:hypothetical protein
MIEVPEASAKNRIAEIIKFPKTVNEAKTPANDLGIDIW